MAENQHSDMFSDTECLSLEIMERYASDTLPPAEQLAVEKHLVDCALCTDALEGLTLAGFSTDVSDRISSLNKKIVGETQQRNTGFWKKQYTSYAAAVIGIMMLSGLVLNYLKTDLGETNYITQDLSPQPELDQVNVPPVPEKDDGGVGAGTKMDALKADEDGSEFAATGSGYVNDVKSEKDEEGERFRDQVSDETSPPAVNEPRDEAEEISGGSYERQSEIKSAISTIAPEETSKPFWDSETDNTRLAKNEDSRHPAKDMDKGKRNGAGLSVEGAAGVDVGGLTRADDYFYKANAETATKGRAKSRELNKSVVSQAIVLEDRLEIPATEQLAEEKSLDRNEQELPADEESTPDRDLAAANAQGNRVQNPGEYDDANTLQNASYPISSSEYNGKKAKSKARKSTNAAVVVSGDQQDVDLQPVLEYNDPYTLGNEAPVTAVEAAAAPSPDVVDAPDSLMGGQVPMFKGGEANLRQYLQDNLVYPDSAIQLGIDCKVYVSFVVNPDSSISDAMVLKPVGGGCDKEALRLVNKMPNWIPAQKKGRKVRAAYNLELDFESIKK